MIIDHMRLTCTTDDNQHGFICGTALNHQIFNLMVLGSSGWFSMQYHRDSVTLTDEAYQNVDAALLKELGLKRPKSIKLSRTQRDVLEYSLVKLNHNRNGICEMWQRLEDGWFYPQHTTRGAIDFPCRWQTCESLRRMGLLESRRRKNTWDASDYRISEKGIKFLQNA